MLALSATEVRKDWSAVLDNTIRQKPQFIKRTRDYLVLSDIKFMGMLLDGYSFTANKIEEEDGSITLSLNELDLVENAPTEEEAMRKLANSIYEYAQEYYEQFNIWAMAPNRRSHVPYVMKALIIDDVQKIAECIQCQAGESSEEVKRMSLEFVKRWEKELRELAK